MFARRAFDWQNKYGKERGSVSHDGVISPEDHVFDP
jgi:hypothetical protein